MSILATEAWFYWFKYTVCQLLELKHDVLVLDNFSNSSVEALKSFKISGSNPKIIKVILDKKT